jgi:hypothetical protein
MGAFTGGETGTITAAERIHCVRIVVIFNTYQLVLTAIISIAFESNETLTRGVVISYRNARSIDGTTSVIGTAD